MQNATLIAIIIVLILVFIGLAGFNFSWYARGQDRGVGLGATADIRIGPNGEAYVAFPNAFGKEPFTGAGLGRFYPTGQPEGPYTSRSPTARSSYFPFAGGRRESMSGDGRYEDALWDTKGGQLGIVSSTIIGEGDKMYGNWSPLADTHVHGVPLL